MRKLQLLVPHYQERPDEIEPLLDSFNIQQQLDFSEVGVVIAYDGPDSTPLPEEEWARRYRYEIRHVKAPKGGVSATRNAAFDASDAEYVMFCDADDMFLTVNAVYELLALTEREKFDTLVSCFVEEQKTADMKERMKEQQSSALSGMFGQPMQPGPDGQPVPVNPDDLPEFIYIPHEVDSTFVHGKVHRREYLAKNNIRFNPNLTVHEDSYFNILAQQLADPDKAKYCPTPFYLWKWRDNSICRHDPDYILKTYNNMLDSNDALVDEFVRRMRDDKANFYVAFMVFDSYYTMNKPEWIDKTHKKYRDAVERRFARYWLKHRDQFNLFTTAEKAQISAGVRTRHVGEGMLMEAITIDQWLKRIEKKAAKSK